MTPPSLPTPTTHSPRPELCPGISSAGISSAGEAHKAAAQQHHQREAVLIESRRLETDNTGPLGQSVVEAMQRRDAAEDPLQAQEKMALPSPRTHQPALMQEKMALPSPSTQPPAVMQPSAPMQWQTSQMQPNALRMSSPRMISPRVISPRVHSPRMLSPRVTSPHMQQGAACLVQRTVSITDTLLLPA